jgi:hypothetical protein
LRDRGEDYSRWTLIKTPAASNTPIVSMPMVIWPSIMLISVQTTVVDPSSIGMAASQLAIGVDGSGEAAL